MSSVLAEIQAGYEQRAKQAAYVPVSPPPAPTYHFPTRTYSGAPLARRQAWGREHGQFMSDYAASKKRKAV